MIALMNVCYDPLGESCGDCVVFILSIYSNVLRFHEKIKYKNRSLSKKYEYSMFWYALSDSSNKQIHQSASFCKTNKSIKKYKIRILTALSPL